MQRENRYMVFKISDIEKYLGEKQIKQLCEFEADINFFRQQDNRGLLSTVVVESDWPEYEPVWKMIEQRVDGTLAQAKLMAPHEVVIVVNGVEGFKRTLDFDEVGLDDAIKHLAGTERLFGRSVKVESTHYRTRILSTIA